MKRVRIGINLKLLLKFTLLQAQISVLIQKLGRRFAYFKICMPIVLLLPTLTPIALLVKLRPLSDPTTLKMAWEVQFGKDCSEMNRKPHLIYQRAL